MRFWFLALALAASACGNSGGGGPDGATDAATQPDRWHGCTQAADALACPAPPCPDAFDGGCTTTTAARTRISVGECAGYATWSSSGVDTTETLYYDDAGALVAIVNESPVGVFCVGGPSDFVPPSGCSETLCSPDGG